MAANTNHSETALVALTRFGLGPRPGDLKRIGSDPRGAVGEELAVAGVALLDDPYLVASPQNARRYQERRALVRLLTGRELQPNRRAVIDAMVAEGRLSPDLVKKATLGAASAGKKSAGKFADTRGMGGGSMDGGDMDGAGAKDKGAAKPGFFDPDAAELPPKPASDEAAARFARARSADIGFAERLVAFWGNHLTVSVRGGNLIRWISGGYEREAIRPHALGRFEDLLLASAKHSAMLHYLDNRASTGPNSEAGKRSGKGLNENYAREVMELHTVGAGAGYTQADVIELAKALTGWRVENSIHAKDFGLFEFASRAHEPGDRLVIGKRYPEAGLAQGEAILRDLARHPATAKRVAQSLATAFVADAPAPALVERLERSFLDTQGDLKALALTLASSDEAWHAPRAKMRSPQEFIYAAIRLVDRQPDVGETTKALKTLGQPLWEAASPKGFSIVGRDWIAPDAQTNRLDFAVNLARDHSGSIDPNALAEDVLGEAMSDETRSAVKRAGSREQAFALLVMSPEMQRR